MFLVSNLIEGVAVALAWQGKGMYYRPIDHREGSHLWAKFTPMDALVRLLRPNIC